MAGTPATSFSLASTGTDADKGINIADLERAAQASKEKRARNKAAKEAGLINSWDGSKEMPSSVKDMLKKGSVAITCNKKGKCKTRPITKPPGGSSDVIKVMSAIRKGLAIGNPNGDAATIREGAASFVRQRAYEMRNLSADEKAKKWSAILADINAKAPTWTSGSSKQPRKSVDQTAPGVARGVQMALDNFKLK